MMLSVVQSNVNTGNIFKYNQRCYILVNISTETNVLQLFSWLFQQHNWTEQKQLVGYREK